MLSSIYNIKNYTWYFNIMYLIESLPCMFVHLRIKIMECSKKNYVYSLKFKLNTFTFIDSTLSYI